MGRAESAWEGAESGRRTWQVFGTEGLLERNGTTDAEEEAEIEKLTAKFSVANENEGNWRKAPKSALADRLERFVKHASEMLALEREAEACTAANLLLQEQSEYPSCPVVLPGAENTPEGTSVGRAGALMEGLMLVGAAPGPEGAGTRLLNFSPAAGGALPPSAINVGDRVAIAVTGVLDDADSDLYEESPAGYEVEGVIQSLDGRATR